MLQKEPAEGYELPESYDDNRIVVMTKDPRWLYIYWDISQVSLDSFVKEFGKELWERSVPSLKITNISNGKEFYIRINEFSKSWYVNVPDSGCLYTAEIGRRLGERFFISFSGSNRVAVPKEGLSSNTNVMYVNVKESLKPVMYKNTGTAQETDWWEENFSSEALQKKGFLKGLTSSEFVRDK